MNVDRILKIGRNSSFEDLVGMILSHHIDTFFPDESGGRAAVTSAKWGALTADLKVMFSRYHAGSVTELEQFRDWWARAHQNTDIFHTAEKAFNDQKVHIDSRDARIHALEAELQALKESTAEEKSDMEKQRLLVTSWLEAKIVHLQQAADIVLSSFEAFKAQNPEHEMPAALVLLKHAVHIEPVQALQELLSKIKVLEDAIASCRYVQVDNAWVTVFDVNKIKKAQLLV